MLHVVNCMQRNANGLSGENRFQSVRFEGVKANGSKEHIRCDDAAADDTAASLS